jgi:hypothetical protein
MATDLHGRNLYVASSLSGTTGKIVTYQIDPPTGALTQASEVGTGGLGRSFALDPFGFLLSSIPLMLLLMRLIDPVRWVLAIPVSVLVPTGMWWLLKHALGIQLPSGMFGIG